MKIIEKRKHVYQILNKLYYLDETRITDNSCQRCFLHHIDCAETDAELIIGDKTHPLSKCFFVSKQLLVEITDTKKIILAKTNLTNLHKIRFKDFDTKRDITEHILQLKLKQQKEALYNER